MTVSRYALVENGTVVNVVLWDGIAPYDPEDVSKVKLADDSPVSIGWTRDGKDWIAPIEPEPEVPDN